MRHELSASHPQHVVIVGPMLRALYQRLEHAAEEAIANAGADATRAELEPFFLRPAARKLVALVEIIDMQSRYTRA